MPFGINRPSKSVDERSVYDSFHLQEAFVNCPACQGKHRAHTCDKRKVEPETKVETGHARKNLEERFPGGGEFAPGTGAPGESRATEGKREQVPGVERPLPGEERDNIYSPPHQLSSASAGSQPVAASPASVGVMPRKGETPIDGKSVEPCEREGLSYVPSALLRLHKRLMKDVELYKLHVKHYHMNLTQFRRRTSELALPDEVYAKYEHVVNNCKECMEAKKTPPRSRFSGIRAHNFGDVVFIDHAEVRVKEKKFLLLLVLDGATSLLWVSPQNTMLSSETIERLREWIDCHYCRPKTVVADMAFSHPDFRTFFAFQGINLITTGARTPWPNRAESAVRLFKHQFELMAGMIVDDPLLRNPTFRQLARACCWARNTQLLITGKTPIELAFGRRPLDILSLETANPEQLIELVTQTRSRQTPQPGYGNVFDDQGRLKFALYFVGGAERKLQVKKIRRDLHIVHATWRFESTPFEQSIPS